MFGPVSGGHFNPVVSFADAAFGGLSWRDAIGLDLSREFPKLLAGDQVRAADIVITMGCGGPVYPGRRYIDWNLPDPAGLDVAAIRPIRDDIRRRVRELLTELG